MAAIGFLSSHVAGLDAVLGGGLLSGSITAIVGVPGAGKTVLSSQILFAAAAAGQKAIILTTFSEGPTKLIAHLRGFDFFTEAVLGTQLELFAFDAVIPDEEPAPALRLARMVRESGATIVLIDGWQGVNQALGSEQQLLSVLATQLTFLGVTLLVTLAGDGRDPRFSSAFTAVDTVLRLEYLPTHRRHTRLIEVVKQRGAAPLPGLHSYHLDQRGFTVYPRIETYPPIGTVRNRGGRAPFGIAELDALLDGGPPAGTTTIMAGAPSTGKTTFGLHWALHAAAPTARTLIVAFSEHAAELEAKAAVFQVPLRAARGAGTIEIMHVPPVDIDPDQVAVELIARCTDPTIARVVLDDVQALNRAVGTRGYEYFAAIHEQLYTRSVSVLSMLEIDPFVGFRLNLANMPLAVMADNLIVLQQHMVMGTLRRFLSVLRMRTSSYETTIREVMITPPTIQVSIPDQFDWSVLDGGARKD